MSYVRIQFTHLGERPTQVLNFDLWQWAIIDYSLRNTLHKWFFFGWEVSVNIKEILFLIKYPYLPAEANISTTKDAVVFETDVEAILTDGGPDRSRSKLKDTSYSQLFEH